jgi:hypothetical protein
LSQSENLQVKSALTPKICDQKLLTHPLTYGAWITKFVEMVFIFLTLGRKTNGGNF